MSWRTILAKRINDRLFLRNVGKKTKAELVSMYHNLNENTLEHLWKREAIMRAIDRHGRGLVPWHPPSELLAADDFLDPFK